MTKVEIEIGDYADGVVVIVKAVSSARSRFPKPEEMEFYFDDDDEANEWIARQKFIVTETHFS
jgi:hypothetical protein